MGASIACAALALRSGLALRRARHGRGRRGPDDVRRHLARAKPAVIAIALGAGGGPLSMALLRGRAPFESAHGWIGALALALFAATALLGRRLERGRGRPLDAHALAAVLALLAAGLAAATGIVLLP
jgi:hypothetical protein